MSCSAPSAFHMWPEVRIIAGIEASTITSLGTCRLVMPLSEFTMASAGPAANSSSKDFLISAPLGSASRPAKMPPRPLLALRPAASRSLPYFAKVCGKKAFTTWPKMIGSDTFIIVALRWVENSTPSSLARCTCSARKESSALARSTVPSTTSPASTFRPLFSSVVWPSAPTKRMVSVSSAGSTTDCSLWRKSSASIVATFVFESDDQAPIECGCALA